MFYIVGTMALWQLFYKAFGDNLEEYHEILAMAMSSGYEKRSSRRTPLVAGHAGICNTITKHFTQKDGICQSHQLVIWLNVMICTNQFLHIQIIIITNPQFLNSLISRNQVTTETKPGDTVALTEAKRSPRWRGLYLTAIWFHIRMDRIHDSPLQIPFPF